MAETNDLPRKVGAETNDLPRDAYALLAQANLLRMRGCWQEAIDRCMDAMRLAPGHASVHSLLGDIYDNRGSLDDAIQWYRMALDVSPDSPADQTKLARLLDVKARQSLPLPPKTSGPLLDPAPAASLASLPVPVRALVGNDPERLLRRAAYGAGLLVLAIIVLAAVLSRPAGRAGAWPGTRQISAPPVVLPSVGLVAASPVESGVPRDPAEQQLLDAVRADGLLAGGDVSVVDVQSDPRASRLSLTVVVTPAANAPATRDLMLRDALRAAQAAARVPAASGVSAFTVRCLLSNGSDTTLTLVADTTRAAITTVGTAPAPSEQIAGAFSGVWWSPSAPAS